jgi:hypothetical protein
VLQRAVLEIVTPLAVVAAVTGGVVVVVVQDHPAQERAVLVVQLVTGPSQTS